MKKRSRDLTQDERMETYDALYTAAGTVRGRAAMKLFLRDLLTESERIMLGRRILIARALIDEETPAAIAARLSVGMDTVYRVQRWLEDQFPGFETAIAEMKSGMAKRKNKIEHAVPFSFQWLKKKYPLHFLLFPK
jgi:uncharacterized protein YerC